MTKQEAINELVLKRQAELMNRNKKLADIYEMAIEALAIQSCEDCISRKEAINVVHKYFMDYLKLNDDICLDGIRSLPSITPHKRGKWLDKKTTIKGGHGLAYGRYGCSVCKKKQPSKTDFCPCCGADMRESEDEDESRRNKRG